jgi:hypothetical protein
MTCIGLCALLDAAVEVQIPCMKKTYTRRVGDCNPLDKHSVWTMAW